MDIITFGQGADVLDFVSKVSVRLRLNNQAVIAFSAEKEMSEKIVGLMRAKLRGFTISEIRRKGMNPVVVVYKNCYEMDRYKAVRVKPVPVIATIPLFTIDGVSYRLIEKRFGRI